MDAVPVAALVPLALFALVWVGYCWLDISRREVDILPKWAWRLICLFSVPVGGIAYMVWGRKDS